MRIKIGMKVEHKQSKQQGTVIQLNSGGYQKGIVYVVWKGCSEGWIATSLLRRVAA